MPQVFHAIGNSLRRWVFGLMVKIFLSVILLSLTLAGRGASADPLPVTVTNLQQLHNILVSARSVMGALKLEVVVCAASQPDLGAVVVQDATGLEFLELGSCIPQLKAGDEIQIEGASCLLRRREPGVEISAAPLVDNDGTHAVREKSGQVTLTAGLHPFRLEWFNGIVPAVLELTCEGPQMPLQKIPDVCLWHSDDDNPTNFLPGLQVQSYEGCSRFLPDFNRLSAVTIGVATNLGLEFCSQPEFVGLRFAGFFRAPRDGKYIFHLRSDDGAMLFVGDACLQVRVVGRAEPPPAAPMFASEVMARPDESRWISASGRVTFVAKSGRGMELELRSDSGNFSVKVAAPAGLNPANLLNTHLRVTGLGQSILTLENRPVLGSVLVVNTNDLKILETVSSAATPPLLTTAEQIQRLPPDEAARQLPVRIRGVVTSVLPMPNRGLTLQDDTRGIFANLDKINSDKVPGVGEFWEVSGHTQPGDFAPSVVAEAVKLLGTGRLPEPAHPTWNQLVNGSLDVQWMEIQGVVTAVSDDQLTLLLPEGSLRAELYLQNETELKKFLNSHVRIRGVLFAKWNATTREVRTGQISFRNAAINIDQAAPQDVFDASLKTARELLRFDVQSAAFQRVKVRGQVIHADGRQIFLQDDKSGLRALPTENSSVQPGDLVEVAGYPEISGVSPALLEAVIRKTGVAAMPAASVLKDAEILQEKNDSTLVRLDGKLLGWHPEADSLVLEMQSGQHLFMARLAKPGTVETVLRVGSHLALTGVYVAQIHSGTSRQVADAFELLLNSSLDLTVLSQPSWWTLKRLLALVGALVFFLVLASVWITQLRRQVEQRTILLQHEIRERERTERERAIEAERSRIARDLHDDLGSSLTEIGVLASTGIRHLPVGEKSSGSFRSIGEKSRELIAALDVIVWAVNPGQNTLQSLADYLSGYVGEYLANAGITCRFKIPDTLPTVTLDGRIRHDVFLAIKEALHNIVRHSRATEVEFHLSVVESVLNIFIADNGCGFVPQAGDGHGLKNLPARLTQAGGSCEVISAPGKGTQLNFTLILPPSPAAGQMV